eukprot:sb/3464467/
MPHPPKRRSAQRAASTLKRLAIHQQLTAQPSSSKDDDESDASVGSDSSTEEEEEEEESLEKEEESENTDLSDSDSVVIPINFKDKNAKRRVFFRQRRYDIRAIYDDGLMPDPEFVTLPKDAVLEPITVADSDSVSVNNQQIPIFQSLELEEFSLGYCGGTPFFSQWIPNTQIFLLAVTSNSHVYNFSAPSITSLQFWKYDPVELNCSIDVSDSCGDISGVAIYPVCLEGRIIVAMATKTGVSLISLDLNTTETHYKLTTPSLLLPTHCPVTAVAFSAVPSGGPKSVIAGLHDGHIIRWSYPDGQLLEWVVGHPGGPIRQISVNSQDPHRFVTTGTDVRISYNRTVWGNKNAPPPQVYHSSRHFNIIPIPLHPDYYNPVSYSYLAARMARSDDGFDFLFKIVLIEPPFQASFWCATHTSYSKGDCVTNQKNELRFKNPSLGLFTFIFPSNSKNLMFLSQKFLS